MKKILKTYWQILILPSLYIPYSILNTEVLVKWLGCGCPKIGEDGKLIENAFNANDFTLIFWSVITLIVVAISFFNMKNLTKRCCKNIYIVLITVGSILTAFYFCILMLWI